MSSCSDSLLCGSSSPSCATSQQGTREVQAYGKTCGYATLIDTLPDDVLIEIFDSFRKSHHYPRSLSWNWHILVHVCRRWRRIVFASPRRLNLRIRCTNGTPVSVRKNLDIWPAFPIVVDYDHHKPITPSDEDNIIAALEHPDRVSYVWLDPDMRGSLFGKISTAMEESFPMLTHLQAPIGNASVLSGRFLGGSAPCLRHIELWGIPFPAKLLLSSGSLVKLYLHCIPQNNYIPPEAMAAVLVTLTSLTDVIIDLKLPESNPDRIPLPPVTRTVLPALTGFLFFGAHEYLEYLAACIDAPGLDSILILYFNPMINFQIPELCKFINCSEMTKRSLPKCCNIALQPNHIALDLEATTLRGDLRISTSHINVSFSRQENGIDGQVSIITQVLSRISPFLSNVIHLIFHWQEINGPLSQPADGIEWLQLLRLFTSVQTLFVSTEFAGQVARALLEDVTGEGVTKVLPALELLCLEDLPSSSVAEFRMARLLSGCPVSFVRDGIMFKKGLESYQSD